MSILNSVDGALGGISGPVVNPIGSLASGLAGSAASSVLHWISSWILGGTRDALREVAGAIGTATAPDLASTWFSSTYWRVAALGAMLTIPFLCAAAVQAVARADLSLLARVTFGYLPVAILGVSLAAPVTMLALAATDQMSALVSAGAATGGASFLDHAAAVAGSLATAAGGSPFFAVVVGLLALMAAMALAIELLIRAAAVYVVVLMLPLAFAALVWPARRIWAVRLVELLASLILSKFVIVAVLSLAAAAFTHGTPGIGELLVAMSLILLSTFAPWALMRILPFTELASGAAGILRNELPHSQAKAAAARFTAGAGEAAMDLPARLREQARSMYARSGFGAEPEPLTSHAQGPAESRSGNRSAGVQDLPSTIDWSLVGSSAEATHSAAGAGDLPSTIDWSLVDASPGAPTGSGDADAPPDSVPGLAPNTSSAGRSGTSTAVSPSSGSAAPASVGSAAAPGNLGDDARSRSDLTAQPLVTGLTAQPPLTGLSPRPTLRDPLRILSPDAETEPFVLPPAWLGDEPVRLDGTLLRPDPQDQLGSAAPGPDTPSRERPREPR